MWKRLPVKGNNAPSIRNCLSMDSDGKSNVMMFGGLGLTAKERFNDVWFYNIHEHTWAFIECHGDVPTPRYCCTLNYCPEKLVCFGGFGDGDRLNTVHVLNTETMDWKFLVTNGEIPEKRSHHTASIAGNRLIVFGGLSQEGKRLNDMHVLDLNTLAWTQPEVSGNIPSPRLGHSCVVLNSNVLLVFGGYGGPEGHTKYNEINLFHFDKMQWTQPSVSGHVPPPMYAHRAAAIRDKMIVFGGDIGSSIRMLSNDLWIFDLEIMRWHKIKCTGDIPPPRSHFGCALSEHQFFIFGGSGKGENEKLNDIYSLDLSSIELLREVEFEGLENEVESATKIVLKEMNGLLGTLENSSGVSNREIRQARKIIDGNVSNSLFAMRTQLDSLIHERKLFSEWKQQQLEQLDAQESQYINQRHGCSNQIVQTKSGRVKLNVGGFHFDTSIATLTRDSSSLLAAMFSGKYDLEVDSDGSYFIDRDGTHFRYCLNYLRDNTVSLPPNRGLHLELLREASYYQLSGLCELLRTSLRKLEVFLEPNGPEAEKERKKGKSKI